MKKEVQEGKKRKEIAVCIPMYGTVTANWLISFMRFLMHEMNKHTIHVLMHEQQPVSETRQILAEQALKKKPDYILWVDSDNVVPTGALDKLIKTIEEEKADLVSALYFGKDTPHYPVIRQWRSGGFFKIENPPLGKIIPIAGCGFGCCLMKPGVFEDLEKPWFHFNPEKWGKKDIVLSEDLYFCKKIQDKKMLCHTGIVSSHIGGAVDVMEYMNFEPIRRTNMEERDECIHDLCDFLGKSLEEVDLNIMVGTELVKEEWEAKNPKTEEEIMKFYKETENYLYDLTLWHFSDRRRYDVELISYMVNLKNKRGKESLKVLDFGCGIGQNAYMLNKAGFDVTIADLDSKTLDFAEYRFQRHGRPYQIWRTDVQEEAPEEKYDVIISFDVFEHLTEKQTKEVVDRLIKLKKEDTMVLLSNNFGTQEGYHPMHFEASEERMKEIERLLNAKK